MVSNRAVFHDPSDVVTERFYGGKPDAMYNGINVELSNDLTIIRAYGTTPFSTATYPTPPLRFFSFEYNGVVQVLVDCLSNLWLDNQDGTKINILSKNVLAGQGYGIALGDTFYYADGYDAIKYTPWNVNALTWRWGIDAPTAAPNVVIQQSGSVSTLWVANTVFSTMGLIIDDNNNIQQLYSVAANGQGTQYGSTGAGAPNFNTTLGSTTVDGSITWKCSAQIVLWQPGTSYPATSPSTACIYDPKTNYLYVPKNGGISGNTRPNFVPNITQTTVQDGSVVWWGIGQFNQSSSGVVAWTKNTSFDKWFHTVPPASIIYPFPPYVDSAGNLCGGRETYLLCATNNGTTANSTYTPWTGVPSQGIGDTTTDGDMIWVCQGPKGWAGGTNYTAWTVGAVTFGVVEDTNGNMQVCIETGTSGGSAPTWGTGYGTTTIDGTITWACVGKPVTWQATTQWYLPPQPAGFVPPQPSQTYGGASVLGSGYIQSITGTFGVGTTGRSQPTWPTTVGNTVSDHLVTWTTIAQYSVNSLAWTQGHVYAFSYKCRTPLDYYVTNNPPGLTTPNGAYKGGGTGCISTASPVFTIAGANSGAINTISGPNSTDPQVDTIVLWRDADGGGPNNMFELTEFPASMSTSPVGPVRPIGPARPIGLPKIAAPATNLRAGLIVPTWSFDDYLPDTAQTIGGVVYPGLNTLIPAPINGSNNPPPQGFLPTAWHFQRVWGPTGTVVNFSGGPDVVTGNPNEAFNTADEFPFLEPVTSCIHTPSGLIVVQPSDVDCIYGGPSTGSFYSTTLFPGKGCRDFNAIDVIGGEIYMFTSDSQLVVVTPSLQVSRIGFPIGDKLAEFDSTKAYLTVYDEGNDNGIYIGNGESGWYRCNPHQVPQGDAIWSPFRQFAQGCVAVQSLVTSLGVQSLLIGGAGANESILMRDQNVFSDPSVGAPQLMSASSYAILAYSGVTNSDGSSTVISGGNIGSYPTGTLTAGSPAWTLSGGAAEVVATAQNQTDLATAITYYEGLGGYVTLTTADMGTQSGGGAPTGHYYGGLYKSGSSLSIATAITLDAQGDPDQQWVFWSGSTVTQAIAGTITLINGAQADNVIWVVGSSWTTVGPGAVTVGNILAHTSITLGGGTLLGRALANNGAVTMATATQITVPPASVVAYANCNFEIGAITLVDPGQVAELKFIEMDFAGVGTIPLVSVALDDPRDTPTWTLLSSGITTNYDPPQVYGNTVTPPYYPIRYYLAPNLAKCRRIRIKVDYQQDTVANELYSFAIYGRLEQDE